MSQLFTDYTTDGFFDEMFEGPDVPRAAYERLFDGLRALRPATFAARSALVDRAYLTQGITFAHGGREQPFPFDLLPRLIPADEWAVLQRGLAQRVRALDMFIADIYGERSSVAAGVVPNRLVSTCEGYVREMVGITPPLGRFVHVAGVDLVRDDDGVWRVLEDNLRCPSGLSYVVQNRAFMRRAFPEAFTDHHVEPVGHAPFLLLSALMASAPEGRESPRVVVLTPGPANAAYYEHSFLAQQMGVPLVEGRDLTVRDRRVYLRTTAGRERVDVIYRRIDDGFLDPASLIADSLLGVAGLMQVCREGRVAVCNAVGTGVADDKAVYAYVPGIIRYFLDEEPILEQVPTYLLEREDEREHALANLDTLVVKAVDGAGGYGMLIGPHATPGERQAFAKRVRANPRGYIAQETIKLSRAPVLVGDRFQGRHVDLRPFVLYGDHPVVVPGGLTRVALRDGSLVVNSSQGGGSKDTWVLSR
ncbi:circularly permuted type 2 ATP-grasp protein [Miltoncostaea oceani]|uniref:circularly permuted type 2 ATP-grasp protein n=1 Tax=Miltoncostaea oceani TaxID=2843216 RepID=UPI001C3D7874|nr:circularly permuted type 2 ATP-grasp protein [Miltoncostaea oceani]